MKNILFFALVLVTTNGLADTPRPSPSPSERDYAVMTADPFKAEIQLGEKRLDKFLRRLDSRRRTLLDQTPYVAIQVRSMSAGDVPWLVDRFFRGTVQSSAYTKDLYDATAVPVQYLLIFDSRTRKMVSEDGGVLITDTPPRYTVARFHSIHAIYAGTVAGW